MSSNDKQPIEIRAGSDAVIPGALNVTLFTTNDRIIRALKTLGLFWVLSLASVPIIIAHWVLVPGFFIAGPVMALRRYRMTQSSDNAEGMCPACRAEIKVDLEPTDVLPKWTYCPKCNAPIHLVPAESS